MSIGQEEDETAKEDDSTPPDSCVDLPQLWLYSRGMEQLPNARHLHKETYENEQFPHKIPNRAHSFRLIYSFFHGFPLFRLYHLLRNYHKSRFSTTKIVSVTPPQNSGV